MRKLHFCLLPLLIAACGLAATAQSAAPAPAKPGSAKAATLKQPQFFAPDAVTHKRVHEAFAAAKQRNRRLLVIYGGAWCALCQEFMQTMTSDDAAGATYLEAYAGVRADTEDFAGLQQFAHKLDPDLKLAKENGPLITVYDQDGSLLDARDITRLLENGHVSGPKLEKFLTRWKIESPAPEIVAKALPQLRSSGKLGFVEFGADWCTWCHHMDKFFDQSAATPILGKYYVRIPVDYERNQGAPEVAAQMGEKGNEGLPWWAIIDANGKVLANCEGPKGCVGFPGDAGEIATFISAVQTTAKDVTPEQLKTIEQALTASK